jgi:transposase
MEVAVKVELEVLESVTKTIGSLALAYPYLRRLGVAETIATTVTRGQEREVPTGQVIEVLVLNRLSLRPSPISKVGAWAMTQAVEEVYGLHGEALNDDRIGRALDDIHPHLTELWAAIVLHGAQAYGVTLGQLHNDVTRLAFEGTYADVPTETTDGKPLVRITYGYTGREDPTRKQATLSLSVSADGGLPTWYRIADGNAADTRAYLAHLSAVRQHLKLDQPLVVGDSKLITRANLLGFCRVDARFIGPTSLTEADRETLLSLWEAGKPFQRLDLPEPAQAPRAGRYWGLAIGEILPDPEHHTSYGLRRLFVQSVNDRKAARHQRAKDLAKAHRTLWTITHRLSRPAYRDKHLVQRKVAEAVAKVNGYLTVEIVETPAGLDLRWRLDRNQLRVDACFDGIYCLVTNQTVEEATLQDVFGAYKGQSKVEGRFRGVKQPPIRVRPLWLHQPKRIESLIFVVMVALYLFALIERAARRVVKASGQVFTGLRPDGRDKLPVTAERLFEVFAPLSLVKQRLRLGTEVVETITPATLSPIQAQLLDRLGLMRPDVYLQPTITPHPLTGCGK